MLEIKTRSISNHAGAHRGTDAEVTSCGLPCGRSYAFQNFLLFPQANLETCLLSVKPVSCQLSFNKVDDFNATLSWCPLSPFCCITETAFYAGVAASSVPVDNNTRLFTQVGVLWTCAACLAFCHLGSTTITSFYVPV